MILAAVRIGTRSRCPGPQHHTKRHGRPGRELRYHHQEGVTMPATTDTTSRTAAFSR